MITFKTFLKESAQLSNKQKFILLAWGQVMYLNYLGLRAGPDLSRDPEFLAEIDEYLKDPHSEDNIDWVASACPIIGLGEISRATVDSLFKLCQTKAEKDFTLYRYDHDDNALEDNSWISTSLHDKQQTNGFYGDKVSEYAIPKGMNIILTHGLADKDEVIMNTNDLKKLKPIRH